MSDVCPEGAVPETVRFSRQKEEEQEGWICRDAIPWLTITLTHHEQQSPWGSPIDQLINTKPNLLIQKPGRSARLLCQLISSSFLLQWMISSAPVSSAGTSGGNNRD